MIDIHTHVIFGVDDGPKNIENSLEIINELYLQGIRTIIATPHRRRGKFDIDWKTVISNFNDIITIIDGRYEDLKIFLGSEIYISSRETIDSIENEEYISLAGSNYVLIEFPYNISYSQVILIINDILMIGKIPVIAHIERYENLFKNINNINELKEMGCVIQVNAGSILSPRLFDKHNKYKKRAKKMLKNNLIDIIASDSHNMSSRPPMMKKAYDLVSKTYGNDMSKKLFFNNADIIVNGKE